VSALRESIRIKATFGEAHALLGEALQRLGEITGAIASYAKALDLDPTLVEVRSRLESLRNSAAAG
jgi:Flp pilus assembly protein TadD